MVKINTYLLPLDLLPFNDFLNVLGNSTYFSISTFISTFANLLKSFMNFFYCLRATHPLLALICINTLVSHQFRLARTVFEEHLSSFVTTLG